MTAGAALALVLAGTTWAAPSAAADGAVTVRGAAFPDPMATRLSFVGCESIGAVRAESPQAYVGLGPGQAPAGQRSLGYDLAGGNAVGAMHVVASVRATSVASVFVHAPAGAQGVAYAGYQTRADRGTDVMWLGRAGLTAAGGWQEVDAMRTSFTWSRVDLSSGTVLEPGPASMGVRAFAARGGGDGGAFFTIGFGCDGQPFSLDALRSGPAGAVTTYDLEGLATTTTISGPTQVDAGKPVRLTGTLRDQDGEPLPWGSVILERRLPGGAWENVKVVEVGPGLDPVATVRPEQTTTYRWRFVDRPLAEASTSASHTVTVAKAGTKPDKPSPSDEPTPSDKPTPSNTPSPSEESSSSTSTPSSTPTTEPSREPSKQPSATPTTESSPASPSAPSASPSARAPQTPSTPSTPAKPTGPSGSPGTRSDSPSVSPTP